MFGRKIFGRKQSQSEQSPEQTSSSETRPGHDHVLALLRREEQAKPFQRAQVAGHVLCDFASRLLTQPDKGARIEDVLALLASVGGFSCLIAAFAERSRPDYRASENDLVSATTADGRSWYMGNLPNHYLIESNQALLSIALGAVQMHGGTPSMGAVHEVMRHVASQLGCNDFGAPRVTEAHLPVMPAPRWVENGWTKLVEALDTYEVQVAQRPATFGYALAELIGKGKDVLSPDLAGQIAVECAIAAAKIDPAPILSQQGQI